MARRRTLTLRPEQQHDLTTLRDPTNYAYVRERCAALLKIASGRSPHWVARHGLLKPRDPETLYSWLDLYAAAGTAGLHDHRHGGQRRGPL